MQEKKKDGKCSLIHEGYLKKPPPNFKLLPFFGGEKAGGEGNSLNLKEFFQNSQAEAAL